MSTILNTLPSNQEFKGNDVILRNTYLPTGARKSWLDISTNLTAGLLKEFFFYTHNFTEYSGNVTIRLQIWRPTLRNATFHKNLNYRLVWEYRVESLNVISSNGILHRVSK